MLQFWRRVRYHGHLSELGRQILGRVSVMCDNHRWRILHCVGKPISYGVGSQPGRSQTWTWMHWIVKVVTPFVLKHTEFDWVVVSIAITRNDSHLAVNSSALLDNSWWSLIVCHMMLVLLCDYADDRKTKVALKTAISRTVVSDYGIMCPVFANALQIS